MIERTPEKKRAAVPTSLSEEERLREQVKKLFRQLESQDLEFHEKEDALKQAVSLLAILARAVSEQELRPLSVGVASARAGDSLETFLDRADRALYLAKERGRNQVRTEEELPSAQSSPLNKVVGFFVGKMPLRKGKNKE